jgi:uncharacterized protein (DUF2147 family)
MSYSRWSSSIWYTFWRADEFSNITFPTQKRKLAQVFEICDFPSYYVTYGELMDKGIIQVLREVKEFYKEKKNPTGSELVELSGYIAQFQKDVDEAFTLKSYLNDIWHLKIKRSIINLFKN